MATMLIPGHDRDALQLLVSFTPDQLLRDVANGDGDEPRDLALVA